MGGMKWFRVYSEIKDDPKVLELDDHQRWLWICLLAMASESSTRGTITNVRLRGLAASLRTDEGRMDACLSLLCDLDMVIYDQNAQIIEISHWCDRQYDKPSDTPDATRDRKRMSRQRHADVTPSHATDTDTDTDTDTEERERTSAVEDVITLTANAVSAPAEKPAKAKTKVRAPKAPPPAEIELIRSITNRYPDKALWDQLVASLSGKSPETVKTAYTTWLARGFRPTNYAWALEWVPNGIPAAPGRNVPNGRATPNGLPSPEMVWGIVQAEIDRVHYSGTPNLPAPILAAVEAVGGWYAVCKSDPAGAIPARLRDAYRAALSAA